MRSASSAARSCRFEALLLLPLLLIPLPAAASGPSEHPWVAPSIGSTVPAGGAVGASLTAPIEVRFTERMNASTVAFAILPSVPLLASWSPGGDVLFLQPTSALTKCTIDRKSVV